MSEEEFQNNEEEEALMKLASAMKDGTSSEDERQNIHTFLTNVVNVEEIERSSKVGNLRDDKDINELGLPAWHVRGALEMSRISDKIMQNTFFKEYFDKQALETLGTSLSREGFLIRQGTTSTKQVADITRRKKVSKGFLGKEKVEEQGGDTTIAR
jgi:hypothetical protein